MILIKKQPYQNMQCIIFVTSFCLFNFIFYFGCHFPEVKISDIKRQGWIIRTTDVIYAIINNLKRSIMLI